MKRELWELQSLQALPLDLKVKKTQQRIREWVDRFGEEGVYVSFSGGKDSTVLLHIVREIYPKVPAVFCDTGLEYPEVRQFVKTIENVEWMKPRLNFRKVIETYGYPFISKETSGTIEEAKHYLEATNNGRVVGAWAMADVLGIERRKTKDGEDYLSLKDGVIPNKYKYGKPVRILQLEGKLPHVENGVATNEYSKMYDKSRWRFLLDAPFNVSNKCCSVMKKEPMNRYARESKRHPITGQMAQESKLRQSNWIRHGCNAFDAKRPISNPMSFWLESDVLQFIKERDIKIAPVYGDVVEENQVVGQMTWDEFCGYDTGAKQYTTTGCKRTGCMFCGYGCHLEKSGEGRFERMKQTHPKQYEYIMKPWSDGGLGYKDVIDWLNENGGLDIRY